MLIQFDKIAQFKHFIYTIFIYVYSFIHLEESFIQSNLQNITSNFS